MSRSSLRGDGRVKRKELKTQRKLFVGNPPPEQKKPRILTPAITIPVPTTDGRLRQRTVAPALEDPTDKASKHIDFIWKSVEWGLQEAVRKEKLQEYENFTDLEGLIRYVTAGGFRAFRNPKVIETLIALQEVVTSAKSKAEREQARREIETLLNAAKVLVQGRRPELTEKERKARKRTSNTAAKQAYPRLGDSGMPGILRR